MKPVMKLLLASIAPRSHTGPMQALVEDYLARTRLYLPVDARVFRTETALFAALEKERGRTMPTTVLLDPRGEQKTSEHLANLVQTHRDAGTQLLAFAVGPADGWSAAARSTHKLLSLGPLTLPHELARLVLAEQLYRACTILAGHPYHAGH